MKEFSREFTEFDRTVAKTLGERNGRTITEIIQDNFGIPQKWFHRLLIFSAIVGCLSLGALVAKHRLNDEINKGVKQII